MHDVYFVIVYILKLNVCVFEGFVETHAPQFARGNVFNQMLSPQQLLEQDQYKSYLKHQVHACTTDQGLSFMFFGITFFF